MFIEVRPHDGGEDAEAFAKELYLSLKAYTLSQGKLWRDVKENPKHLVAESTLPSLRDFEGLHKVQRYSGKTGKRHTSTASVSLVEKQTVSIDLSRIDVEFFRGSGPGGQHKNKTETGVRMVDRKTGITVSIQDERSQRQNYQKAEVELTRRLQEKADAEAASKEQSIRVKSLEGQKSFTHNEQRQSVTDHTKSRTWQSRDFAKGRLDKFKV